MKTIKSFNDFEKSDAKVEEQLFKGIQKRRSEKKAVTNLQGDDSEKVRGVRGKEVWRDQSGKKHKVIWRAQDTNNFIVKLVNDYNWLDSKGNLTTDGQSALLQFLNEENSFVNQYGKLDGSFFSKNVIVYSVKRDNDRRQKIQFSIVDRASLNAKIEAAAQDGQQMLTLDGVNFVNASVIVAIDKGLSDSINTNLDKTILKVEDETEDVEDTEDTEDVEDTEEDVIPLQDDSLIGKQFEYQSGADGKLYIITVDKDEDTGGLKFWARSKDGTKEGWVVLKGEEPFWMSRDGSSTAVTNAKDRSFFIRIFTDMDYLRQLIAAFEEKYPDGFDFTVKDILYYLDGTKIYDAEPEDTGAAAASAFLNA